MNRTRGFTLMEFVVVTAVVGIIAGVLLDRFLYYQELVEKTSMEYSIARFKSGLRIRKATLLVTGRSQETISLVKENPIDWLDEADRPRNYISQPLDSGEPVVPGNWYFDSRSDTLTYIVKSGRYFQPDSAGQKRIRLRLVFLNNFPKTADISIQATDSVAFALVEPYKWF